MQLLKESRVYCTKSPGEHVTEPFLLLFHLLLNYFYTIIKNGPFTRRALKVGLDQSVHFEM